MLNYIKNIIKRGSFEFAGNSVMYIINSVDNMMWFRLSDICSAINVTDWCNPKHKNYLMGKGKLDNKRRILFTQSKVYAWGINEEDVVWLLEEYAEANSARAERAARLLGIIKKFIEREKIGDLEKKQTLDLREYFLKVKELMSSNNKFPVDLNDVWALAYGNKSDAVKSLKRKCVKYTDYQSFIQNTENPHGGRPAEKYMLSVPCMEYLIARKVPSVFEVYRQVFHEVVNPDLSVKVNFGGFPIPQKFSDALLLSAHLQQKVEEQEAKIEEDKPKVEYYTGMVENRDYFTTTTIATELRTTSQVLNQFLCNKGVLTGKSGSWKVTDEHQTLLSPSPFKSIIRWNHEGRTLIHQLWEEKVEELVEA